MFLKILINYILGYVNIEVEGFYIERFINMCISKRIFLWNINRKKSSIMSVSISIYDFKKIREIVKKTGCKIKINNKKGIPFIFDRYKKRKIFFIMLMITIVVIYILSKFIWNIEIVGISKINVDEIYNGLYESGLKIGSKKSDINTKDIINNIRLNREDIAWIGIDIKGTNAKINIVEATEKPEIIKEDEYCNIVANKKGIITKINALNGTPIAKVGDLVSEGDILIAGWMEGKYTGKKYVHSLGEIEAKVWYIKKAKIPLKETQKNATGKMEEKYSIKFNNFKINFHKRLSNFENYDTMYETKKLKIFTDYYLPIEIIKTINQEIVLEEKIYSLEEAKKIGIQRLENEFEKEGITLKKAQNKQINTKENENEIEIELIYEVIENIGSEEKIVF